MTEIHHNNRNIINASDILETAFHEIGRGSLGVRRAAPARELGHQRLNRVQVFAVFDNHGERVPESVSRQDESLLFDI